MQNLNLKIRWHQIRTVGIKPLWRELQQFCLQALAVLLLPITIWIVFVIRLLKPWIHIRFRMLPSSHIAHFLIDTEFFLRKRNEKKSNLPVDLFYHHLPICNSQLKIMWERILWVCPFVRFLDRANRLLPGWKTHSIPPHQITAIDTEGILEKYPPALHFTPEEKKRGQKGLKALGIGEGIPFVCFYSRSHEYLERHIPLRYCRYNDFRDTTIDNYIPMLKALINRGYVVVRLGAYVSSPLSFKHPQMIDYAYYFRNDFMDIYLGANCTFLIGDTAGIYALGEVFRKPHAFVNFVPLAYLNSWQGPSLVIPKKLWSKRDKRFLTFPEILNSEVGTYFYSEKYEKAEIDVIENTPEEILQLAIEMDERLKNNWTTTEKDEVLQRCFRDIFKHSQFHGGIKSRIGTHFLRQNQNLFM